MSFRLKVFTVLTTVSFRVRIRKGTRSISVDVVHSVFKK